MFLAYPATSPVFVTFILYSITTSEPLRFLDFISAFANVVFSFWAYSDVFESFFTVIFPTYFCNFKSNVLLKIKPTSIFDIFFSRFIVSVVPAVIVFPSIVISLEIASEFSVSLAPFTWYVVVP